MDVARPRPEAPPVMMKVRCLICIFVFFFLRSWVRVECRKEECEDDRVSEVVLLSRRAKIQHMPRHDGGDVEVR